MKRRNLILDTDSYKASHWKQMPPHTTTVYSYQESRGGLFDATIFSLLQYYLKEYIMRKVTIEDIEEADEFFHKHFGTNQIFNQSGWLHILNEYGGILPLEIKAVPEGTLVPVRNVLMTITNTDPKLAWLTNYVETLLMKTWAPITVGTNSYNFKKRLIECAIKTGSDTKGINYKLHDFGYRGVSSEESAGILGAAHLMCFEGSDNLAAIRLVQDYYGMENGMPAYSVPASEHSVATSFGLGYDNEKRYVLNMLNQFPSGTVSIIGDSYNIKGFATMIGRDGQIREAILSRPGVFVLRLDSGDPLEVIPEVLNILWACFGGTYTTTHHRLLNNSVRILQGDGITLQSTGDILQRMETEKWASDNIVFGSGGGLLQKFDRDTQKFAIKCSLAIIDGKQVDVRKNPVNMPEKKSKAGYLKLHYDGSSYMTYSSADQKPIQFGAYIDSLETVYKDGTLTKEYSFADIRERVDGYIQEYTRQLNEQKGKVISGTL